MAMYAKERLIKFFFIIFDIKICLANHFLGKIFFSCVWHAYTLQDVFISHNFLPQEVDVQKKKGSAKVVLYDAS